VRFRIPHCSWESVSVRNLAKVLRVTYDAYSAFGGFFFGRPIRRLRFWTVYSFDHLRILGESIDVSQSGRLKRQPAQSVHTRNLSTFAKQRT
jgi:hypothetical protein